MKEQRNYIRVEVPIPVAYKLRGENSMIKKALTKNFSEMGIRFSVYEELKVDTPLELHIEIPFDTMPVFAQGEVVWAKALGIQEGREVYDIGVKFTEMQPFDKKRMFETTKHFLTMDKKYRAG